MIALGKKSSISAMQAPPAGQVGKVKGSSIESGK